MSWYRKEVETRLDHSPIEGLFFLDGDLLAHQQLICWSEGLKSPMIQFPSGETLPLEWDKAGNPSVHLFPGMDLPFYDTYESAWKRACAQVEDSWFSIFGVDAQLKLELWSHQTEEVFFVTYDDQTQCMVDVVIAAA